MKIQPVDYTTLVALVSELRRDWLPSRLEQIYQYDPQTLCLCLRTLNAREWLWISWHPQAARMHIGDRPPRDPDTFTFSEQLRHQIKGLALTAIEMIAPWERVVDLQFGKRPGDPPLWHLFVEIMGKHSNVILTDQQQQIVTTAQQISSDRSTVRPVETGQAYQLPPALTNTIPSLDEPFERWQERVALLPKPITKQLLSNYRGVSPVLLAQMLKAAAINPDQNAHQLTDEAWHTLFSQWRHWLQCLVHEKFLPLPTQDGYSVVPWQTTVLPLSQAESASSNLQVLIETYYRDRLNQQQFQQLYHQLQQKLHHLLTKLQQKAQTFGDRLRQSEHADLYRKQGDLLMSYLHEWQVGMSNITLTDFESGEPITIPLQPDKNAVQNAQWLYKQHQKLKRARLVVQPLLDEVQAEIRYLEQIEASLQQLSTYHNPNDLETLQEIRAELVQQHYLATERNPTHTAEHSKPHIYPTPSGNELWIGRNNRQNDRLTFRIANVYDLWFHSQEIPGSHVLLRLQPGDKPDNQELQWAADFAAYYSRARQSEQVPIIYTHPKNVYKPKGAKPGMCIYKRETILWGQPQRAQQAIAELDLPTS